MALGSRGLQGCLRGSLSINWHHSAAVCKSFLFSAFYEMFLKHRSPSIVNYNSKRFPVGKPAASGTKGALITTARTLLSSKLCLGNHNRQDPTKLEALFRELFVYNDSAKILLRFC